MPQLSAYLEDIFSFSHPLERNFFFSQLFSLSIRFQVGDESSEMFSHCCCCLIGAEERVVFVSLGAMGTAANAKVLRIKLETSKHQIISYQRTNLLMAFSSYLVTDLSEVIKGSSG